MKIMKPIWKAVFSSLITKAGTMALKGMSCADSGLSSGAFTRARRAKSSRSEARVCFSMKSRSGTLPFCRAVSKSMRFSARG